MRQSAAVSEKRQLASSFSFGNTLEFEMNDELFDRIRFATVESAM
jgi:hypothetical protein